MLIRIAIGLVLVAYLAVGSFVLWIGAVLHFSYRDASDPAVWADKGSLWLGYLAALVLFWGASAVSILWPGQRSAQLRQVLGIGAIAAGLSGGALLAASFVYGAERFYTELAGLVVLSAIAAGFGQAWLSRRAPPSIALAQTR